VRVWGHVLVYHTIPRVRDRFGTRFVGVWLVSGNSKGKVQDLVHGRHSLRKGRGWMLVRSHVFDRYAVLRFHNENVQAFVYRFVG